MNEPAAKTQILAPLGPLPPPIAPLPAMPPSVAPPAPPVPPPASHPASDDMIKTTQFVASDIVAAARAQSSASIATAKPKPRWPILVKTHVAHAVTQGAQRLRAAQVKTPTLSRADVGVACGIAGASMVLAAIVFGWIGVLAPTLDKFGAAAGAVVGARAAIAVATMAAGAWLIATAERFSRDAR